jgi:hypothetical protein
MMKLWSEHTRVWASQAFYPTLKWKHDGMLFVHGIMHYQWQSIGWKKKKKKDFVKIKFHFKWHCMQLKLDSNP